MNYSNKTFADEKFTVEKIDATKEVDLKIGLFEGLLETMVTSFDSYLETNHLELIF